MIDRGCARPNCRARCLVIPACQSASVRNDNPAHKVCKSAGVSDSTVFAVVVGCFCFLIAAIAAHLYRHLRAVRSGSYARRQVKEITCGTFPPASTGRSLRQSAASASCPCGKTHRDVGAIGFEDGLMGETSKRQILRRLHGMVQFQCSHHFDRQAHRWFLSIVASCNIRSGMAVRK